jgi:hypothetical protein
MFSLWEIKSQTLGERNHLWIYLINIMTALMPVWWKCHQPSREKTLCSCQSSITSKDDMQKQTLILLHSMWVIRLLVEGVYETWRKSFVTCLRQNVTFYLQTTFLSIPMFSWLGITQSKKKLFLVWILVMEWNQCPFLFAMKLTGESFHSLSTERLCGHEHVT